MNITPNFNIVSWQIELWDRLMPFGAESFVFHFYFQKYKDQDIEECNFACCFCLGVKLGISHCETNVVTLYYNMDTHRYYRI
jgi:hypothetical protein